MANRYDCLSENGGVVIRWSEFDKFLGPNSSLYTIIYITVLIKSKQSTGFSASDCRFQYTKMRCLLPDRNRRRYNRHLCRCVFTFTSSRSAPDAAAAAVHLSVFLSICLSAAHSAAVLARLSFVANSHAPHFKVGQTGLNELGFLGLGFVA